VTRTAKITVAVSGVCGVVTAVAAVGIVTESSGQMWQDTLPIVGAVVILLAIGWIVATIAIIDVLEAGTLFVRRAATPIFAPTQPTGLDRISTVIERMQAEQEASGHGHETPPEMASALRELAARGHRRALPGH
jgi:hypothetical protein